MSVRGDDQGWTCVAVLSARPLSRRLVATLGALAAFGPLATDVYLPALPDVGTDLGASPSAVALTLTGSIVGLGAGQLLVGPLSDRFGRRRPLLVGLAVFAVASVLCAVAPTLGWLVAARLLQALGGSAGIVLSRAVARDLRSGEALVRLFAVLVGISSLAPIVAPVLGAQLVRFTSWHGVFAVLAVVGGLLLAAAAAWVPETLTPLDRHSGGVRAALRAYRGLLADPQFVILVLAGALAFAVLFAYITASPFVLQEGMGLSPLVFSLDFALNAVGLLLATRFATRVPLPAGAVVLVIGALLVLLGVALPGAVLAGFGVIAVGFGLVIPGVSGRAMTTTAGPAGAAAALFGAVQYVLGGAVAPVASIGAGSSVLALGVVTTVAALGVLAATRVSLR